MIESPSITRQGCTGLSANKGSAPSDGRRRHGSGSWRGRSGAGLAARSWLPHSRDAVSAHEGQLSQVSQGHGPSLHSLAGVQALPDLHELDMAVTSVLVVVPQCVTPSTPAGLMALAAGPLPAQTTAGRRLSMCLLHTRRGRRQPSSRLRLTPGTACNSTQPPLTSPACTPSSSAPL